MAIEWKTQRYGTGYVADLGRSQSLRVEWQEGGYFPYAFGVKGAKQYSEPEDAKAAAIRMGKRIVLEWSERLK